MNLPNQLTLLRLILVGLFVLFKSFSFPYHHSLSLVLFLLAVATDYLDGAVARKLNQITDFGKLMDPLADKILTASAFILLSAKYFIPPWAVILIITREFLITGLRLLASSKGIVLPAERLGKHKTAWQMITIIYYLTLSSLAELPALSPFASNPWLQTLGSAFVAITILLTIYSGITYLYKNRSLLYTPPAQNSP